MMADIRIWKIFNDTTSINDRLSQSKQTTEYRCIICSAYSTPFDAIWRHPSKLTFDPFLIAL